MGFKKKDQAEKKLPVLKSEFSMGALDFQRFHNLLILIDNYAAVARVKPTYATLNCWCAYLKQMYINIRPYARKELKELDDKFSNLQKAFKALKKNRTSSIHKTDILDRLEAATMQVYQLRARLGLGFPVKEEGGLKSKIEKTI